tara:strand:- start:1255 stop:1581 length:327 start_codon:yes stop_codon:yes gene_type:complete
MSKEIKEVLKGGDVKFTVKGITTYCKGDDGEYGMNPKIFTVDKDAGSIWAEFHGMNVTKWGPTCVTLYTFNMLGKKSTGKINYKDITPKETVIKCSAALDNEWANESI